MALHPRVMLHETLFGTTINCSAGALKITIHTYDIPAASSYITDAAV